MPWDNPTYSVAESWTGLDWTSTAARTLRLDPYLVWAEATDYRELGGRPDEWVPVIIEVAPYPNPLIGPTAGFAADIDQRADNQGASSWIRIHDRYRNPLPYLRNATFLTAMVRALFFEKALTDAALQSAIVRFELALPIVQAELIDAEPRPAVPNVAHRTNGAPQCTVGIIDDGIAFAQQRFRGPNGTRVEFFWDQAPFRRNLAPEYGRELTNAAIDQLVQQHTRGGLVEEDSLYASIGYRECRRRSAHGTMTLDAAAGFEPADAPPGSPIIAVQLQTPSRRTRDRSASWLASRVLDGLRYILDREQTVAPAGAPLVVNMSFGNIAGPHDGSSMIEAAMDQLIQLRQATGTPFEIVIAAGNSNLVRAHGVTTLAGGQTDTLAWRVMPDDPTPSFLEIWLDPTNAGNDGCELVITTPEGETCVPMREGALRVLRANDDVVGTAFYARRVSTGNRALVLVALSPTASRGNVARPTAPAGDWNIAIRNLNASAPLTVDTWIQRDDTPWDFPRQGRQSHFSSAAHRKSEDKPSPGLPHRPRGDVKDDDVGNDSSIRCRGTLNSIGTGTRTLVIGAFRAARGRAAPYSSSGPTTTRPGPNAAALSDLSTARPGIIGAGSHSGSAVTINGTSVSAAAITRFVAERMRNFGWNGVDTLNAAAAASEATNAFYFPRAVDRVGEGRLLTAEINNGRQGKVTR